MEAACGVTEVTQCPPLHPCGLGAWFRLPNIFMLSSLGFKMQTKNSTSSYLCAADLVFSKSKLLLLVKFHVWVHIAIQAGAGLPYASFGKISAFLVCLALFGSLRNRAGK